MRYKYSFNNNKWRDELIRAYSFRFTETPDFKEESDCIRTDANLEHREGFDNISLLFPEPVGDGIKGKLRCSFVGDGCPEIILVKKPEKCDDNFVRYGECFEVVLWRKGVNVWRHFIDENYKCTWENRLRCFNPVSERDVHELAVEIQDKHIIFTVDDSMKTVLYVADLFEEFYIGITACEGIVHLYDFLLEKNEN